MHLVIIAQTPEILFIYNAPYIAIGKSHWSVRYFMKLCPILEEVDAIRVHTRQGNVREI